ncbi:MAG: hypothetical protein H6623_04075 [Bdellovibrionaceae bacterium]|nr:hypothetical protein [Pseudobdellovibrionaceae bacterium]
MHKKKNNSIAKPSLPDAYTNLLEQIGFFIEYWGFKEVHGQVWACIFLSERPTDANHIIHHLQLSKAAVSLALKDLLHYEVIMEVEKTEPSTRKYISNPNMAEVICNVLREREKQMLTKIVLSAKTLLSTPKEEFQRIHVSKERVQNLKEMTEGAQSLLEQMLDSQQVDLVGLFQLLNLKT